MIFLNFSKFSNCFSNVVTIPQNHELVSARVDLAMKYFTRVKAQLMNIAGSQKGKTHTL